MKLKATKYLLPTTEGRLHKELSYLISLHKNKMNKGKLESRISDLEHQFKQLEHNYRKACLEFADSDNEIKPIESTQELFNQPLTIEQLKEGDVLVYEGSQYAFLTKGKEYKVFNLEGSISLLIKGDKGGNFSILLLDIDQFTLKAKPSEEQTKSRFDYDQDPITSTTLKTPNEWLKLMSEEERTQWKENRDKADGWKIDMYKEYTFEDMIMYSFHWLSTPQGYDYWENLYNRYNN